MKTDFNADKKNKSAENQKNLKMKEADNYLIILLQSTPLTADRSF